MKSVWSLFQLLDVLRAMEEMINERAKDTDHEIIPEQRDTDDEVHAEQTDQGDEEESEDEPIADPSEEDECPYDLCK